VDSQSGGRSGRRPLKGVLRTRAAYIAIIALVALATVAGMVALWPRGKDPRLQFAQVVAPGKTYAAEVSSTRLYNCPPMAKCQLVRMKLNSGPDDGRTTTAHISLGPSSQRFSDGDKLRVAKNRIPAGPLANKVDPYTILDFERRPPMLLLALIFAALVIVFGRLRGALSLVGLGVSLLIVLLFVVPALLHDSSPLAVALVGSMAVMLTTILLAHGIGPKSLAAMTGTAVSLLLVVGLAVVFTHATHLTGIESDEAAILGDNNHGISLQGLLIAGMVIGSLGILDDVTVSQASTVMALRGANPEQRFGELFRRAIDVGRDHVSATVNTLVLAYVGSSLTTLLIFGSGQIGVLDAVNIEVIASVVVATLVGSIGLICAVPITTALAALLAEGIPARELVDSHAHLAHAH
jgi:uncharacterized membrane protein